MTNLSKLLELTTEAKINTQDNNTYTSLMNLTELEKLIKEYMLLEIANSKGKNYKSRFVAANKYIDKIIKSITSRNNFHGTWFIDEYQYLCSGFSAIKLSQNFYIDNLKNVDDDIEKFSINKIFDDLQKSNTIVLGNPDINELKMQLKVYKSEFKATKDNNLKSGMFKLGNSWFSVELFLEIISMLPSDNFKILGNENTTTGIYIYDNDDNYALLLPIRCSDDE